MPPPSRWRVKITFPFWYSRSIATAVWPPCSAARVPTPSSPTGNKVVVESHLADLKRRMDGALEALRREFAGLRTGRASAHLLEPVNVHAYGNEMPITQVGTINVPEPRMITVQVWDRGLVSAVEKAIRDAGLGLNPSSDGQLVRVPIPELSQERRGEMGKIAHTGAQPGRCP